MYLNSKTKQLLEKAIGKSILELSEMDIEEEYSFIESKIGKNPKFSKKADSRMKGRGNPLLARRKICTINDIDKKIMELK